MESFLVVMDHTGYLERDVVDLRCPQLVLSLDGLVGIEILIVEVRIVLGIEVVPEVKFLVRDFF